MVADDVPTVSSRLHKLHVFSAITPILSRCLFVVQWCVLTHIKDLFISGSLRTLLIYSTDPAVTGLASFVFFAIC